MRFRDGMAMATSAPHANARYAVLLAGQGRDLADVQCREDVAVPQRYLEAHTAPYWPKVSFGLSIRRGSCRLSGLLHPSDLHCRRLGQGRWGWTEEQFESWPCFPVTKWLLSRVLTAATTASFVSIALRPILNTLESRRFSTSFTTDMSLARLLPCCKASSVVEMGRIQARCSQGSSSVISRLW
jgi:hypothetical protein